MTRRADRLFQIVQILRGRRLTTAAHLADRLGVSERTVYRDIRDLSLSGVPVEGEAGSGYRLMSGFDLPPLMLTNKESEALIVAIRLLKTWGGESLSRELESAQEKVLAILPELIRIGVAAVKVEGRQRSPAYVAEVTRTLRAALDAAANPDFQVRPQWSEALDKVSEGHQQTLGAYSRPWK